MQKYMYWVGPEDKANAVHMYWVGPEDEANAVQYVSQCFVACCITLMYVCMTVRCILLLIYMYMQ